MGTSSVVTVYTRPNCHLCEQAIETIERIAEEHGFTIDIETVNVDEDPELRSQYGHRLPCIFIDDTLEFEYRIDEYALIERLDENHGH